MPCTSNGSWPHRPYLAGCSTDAYGVQIPFQWVRVSPHGPLARFRVKYPSSGSALGEVGHVAMLSSLKAALGDPDRVEAWLVVSGFVNLEPGYGRTTDVLNACSELILQLYGSKKGADARTAIGAAALPLNRPVVISAEVEITTL